MKQVIVVIAISVILGVVASLVNWEELLRTPYRPAVEEFYQNCLNDKPICVCRANHLLLLEDEYSRIATEVQDDFVNDNSDKASMDRSFDKFGAQSDSKLKEVGRMYVLCVTRHMITQ